jgi:hypothetical protein
MVHFADFILQAKAPRYFSTFIFSFCHPEQSRRALFIFHFPLSSKPHPFAPAARKSIARFPNAFALWAYYRAVTVHLPFPSANYAGNPGAQRVFARTIAKNTFYKRFFHFNQSCLVADQACGQG